MPRRRDLDLDEERVAALLLLGVLVVAAVLYVGASLSGGDQGEGGPSAVAGVARSTWSLNGLLEDFVGPPPPPYPPPITGAPGRGGVNGADFYSVVVMTPGVAAERARRRLLAESFPAYLRPQPGIAPRVLVGDYATEEEAWSVVEELRRRGFEAEMSRNGD